MARILVIDDEESIRFSFQMFLSNAGHKVAVAENTIDATNILSGNEFDVAVIDRILKDGQNGLDFIKYIRNVQPLCEPILISAYPSFSSAAETLQYNIFAYLTKPVKQEDICRVVKEAACRNKENKKKEKQFLHMQKMEAIGTLAEGFVHDLNNILMLMLGYIELAIIDTPEDSQSRKNLIEAIKALDQARKLTKKILTCSRKNEQERMPILKSAHHQGVSQTAPVRNSGQHQNSTGHPYKLRDNLGRFFLNTSVKNKSLYQGLSFHG